MKEHPLNNGSQSRICGAFAPVPTPVDSAGRLDIHSLTMHLKWLPRGGPGMMLYRPIWLLLVLPLVALLFTARFPTRILNVLRGLVLMLLVICLWIFVMLQFGQSLLPTALQRPRKERL